MRGGALYTHVHPLPSFIDKNNLKQVLNTAIWVNLLQYTFPVIPICAGASLSTVFQN